MKVHVWVGISRKGATQVCIFEGTMDRFLYVEILKQSLLPFSESTYPASHRFMQDNDPKHVSAYARDFMVEKGVH